MDNSSGVFRELDINEFNRKLKQVLSSAKDENTKLCIGLLLELGTESVLRIETLDSLRAEARALSLSENERFLGTIRSLYEEYGMLYNFYIDKLEKILYRKAELYENDLWEVRANYTRHRALQGQITMLKEKLQEIKKNASSRSVSFGVPKKKSKVNTAPAAQQGKRLPVFDFDTVPPQKSMNTFSSNVLQDSVDRFNDVLLSMNEGSNEYVTIEMFVELLQKCTATMETARDLYEKAQILKKAEEIESELIGISRDFFKLFSVCRGIAVQILDNKKYDQVKQITDLLDWWFDLHEIVQEIGREIQAMLQGKKYQQFDQDEMDRRGLANDEALGETTTQFSKGYAFDRVCEITGKNQKYCTAMENLVKEIEGRVKKFSEGWVTDLRTRRKYPLQLYDDEMGEVTHFLVNKINEHFGPSVSSWFDFEKKDVVSEEQKYHIFQYLFIIAHENFKDWYKKNKTEAIKADGARNYYSDHADVRRAAATGLGKRKTSIKKKATRKKKKTG